MKILVYDTETTGLISKQLPLADKGQPVPCQIAAGIFDEHGTLHTSVNMKVMIGDAPMDQKAFEAHGISREAANEFGFFPITALSIIRGMVSMSNVIVAFNQDFDRELLLAAMARYMPQSQIPFNDGKKLLCAKEMSEPLMKLPPTQRMIDKNMGHKFKSPNLMEAHRHFIGSEFEGAHDGFADMMACARVFFEIIKREGWEKYGVNP